MRLFGACCLLGVFTLTACAQDKEHETPDQFPLFDPVIKKYFAPYLVDAEHGIRAHLNRDTLDYMEEIIRYCHLRVRLVSGHVLYRHIAEHPAGFHIARRVDLLKDMLMLAKMRENKTNVDFYLNLCDHPQSMDSSQMEMKSIMFPIFTPHASTITRDIPYPDTIDLSPNYFPETNHTAWENRKPTAVFRGSTTNFWLFLGNWRVNPRVQLARLSQRHPDLVNAGIISFSQLEDCPESQRLEKVYYACATNEGMCCVPGGRQTILDDVNLTLAKPLTYTEIATFKYVIMADGGLGDGRLCGYGTKLKSTILMQKTPFYAFFKHLMKPWVHYVPLESSHWQDLTEKIKWLRDHDAEAHKMAEEANKLLSVYCGAAARVAYWHKLLDTYSSFFSEPPPNDWSEVQYSTACTGRIPQIPRVNGTCPRVWNVYKGP